MAEFRPPSPNWALSHHKYPIAKNVAEYMVIRDPEWKVRSKLFEDCGEEDDDPFEFVFDLDEWINECVGAWDKYYETDDEEWVIVSNRLREQVRTGIMDLDDYVGPVVEVCAECNCWIHEEYDFLNADKGTLCRPCSKNERVVAKYMDEEEEEEEEEES